MTRIARLDIQSEGTGISRPLSENVNLLGALLGRAIAERAGEPVLALVEELRGLCKRAAAENDESLRDQAADRIRTLDAATIGWVLRAFDTFFHLVNQAEKQEIQRVNRERSLDTASAARPESIDDAVGRLKAEGRTLQEVMALIATLDVQPTFTAHPTEARRRSVLDKQRRIAELLQELRRPGATADEMEDAEASLYDQIALLLATDEIRNERPTVQDEVEQGLYFLSGSVWDTAPLIHRDMVRALERHYGQDAAVEIPVFLRWRSWIGSDRDGNPNVTADVTRWTLARHRNAVLARHIEELSSLRDELSISSHQVATPDALVQALAALGDCDVDEGSDEIAFRHEPYRRFITCMIRQIEATAAGRTPADAYTAAMFIAHLDVMHESLVESGFAEVATHGRLARIRTLARTFGFHLVAMDVRQHSRVHEEAIAALLKTAGVTDDYAALTEDEKMRMLDAELRNPRPLVMHDATLPDVAKAAIETFEAVRDALHNDPASIGCYIVSMTKSVSDLLEPMLLAKEAGIWRVVDGQVQCDVDFVPLFETIEDLADAAPRMQALFDHPLYALHLRARGGFQEIMLGYSDSNKDGGYWMANWALHRAQAALGDVCRRNNIEFRLFHGRGGSVGRGGGRANLAITAMPNVVHNGRIRVTEQGEVISFRYALKQLAHRHTEQLVSATLTALSNARHDPADAGRQVDPASAATLDTIADASMHGYRQLIDAPDFWPWFTRITPIHQIGHLPIASRPVSRGSGKLDFEGLRAIPWVFSWTQTRYLVPGWFGTGAALTEANRDPATKQRLRDYYQDWPFFRVLVDNAQREMARARLEIAQRYARLAHDDSNQVDPHHERIAADFQAAAVAFSDITGQSHLLEFGDVIRKSIALRNPYTDVLNLVQIELLVRARAREDAPTTAGPDAPDEIRQLLFLSINGIAAAMQSTG